MRRLREPEIKLRLEFNILKIYPASIRLMLNGDAVYVANVEVDKFVKSKNEFTLGSLVVSCPTRLSSIFQHPKNKEI